MTHRPRTVFTVIGLWAAAALGPGAASAQILPRLSLHGELGAGSMLSGDQRNNLGLGLGVQGSLRGAVEIVGPLSLQVSGTYWDFPAGGNARGGFATTITGGLRLEPSVGSLGRWFIDANVGAGLTGSDLLVRLAWDVGAGFEFHLAGPLYLGPAVRLGQLVSGPNDLGSATYITAGISVGLHPQRTEEPPPDADHDGVLDPTDQCPDTPAGDHPDPARPGCPLGDRDHDGVLDPTDQCPDTPAGDHPDPARPGCPLGDRDHDGVLDPTDQCPDTPAGVYPDPARRGCPIGDRDGDTVLDNVDHCPDQPGAPSADPLRNGCPGLVRIESGQVRISRPVFFATNRDTILPRSFPVLQAVADALQASPGIRKVLVAGHTDNVGPEARNQRLSELRAASVVRWLAAHGVAASRLEAHGYGSSRPVASNLLVAGRAANRRVEFHIVDPAPTTGATPAAHPSGPRVVRPLGHVAP